MALTRKDKPQWFELIDKIKAIRELEYGNGRELAEHLGVAEPRVTEWVTHMREAKADTAMKIEDWIEKKELAIVLGGKLTRYKKIIKRLKIK